MKMNGSSFISVEKTPEAFLKSDKWTYIIESRILEFTCNNEMFYPSKSLQKSIQAAMQV